LIGGLFFVRGFQNSLFHRRNSLWSHRSRQGGSCQTAGYQDLA
jgi:hypothetical protein